MKIEELLKDYCDELYYKYPLFFKYLPVINMYAGYLTNLCGLLNKKMDNITEYNTDIDIISMLDICNKILSSIDEDLCAEFNKKINDGTIQFNDESEYDYSFSKIENGEVVSEIKRKYTIQDVVETIHEFFHIIHIEKYDKKYEDQDCYLLTEGVALIGEIYSILYMHEKNILREDLLVYFKQVINAMDSHSSDTLITGSVLNIYDVEQSFSEEAMDQLIEVDESSSEHDGIGDLLLSLDEFPFHTSSTYVFGFPIAILVASKMLEDEMYKKRVMHLLGNISDYNIESLLSFLGIEKVIGNEDDIYSVINYIYTVSNRIINAEKIDIKKFLVTMRES